MPKLKNKITKELYRIKWEYYAAAQKYNTRGLSKGDIRAYLGLFTWFYERDLLKNNEDKFRSHQEALKLSLEHYKGVTDKKELSEDFSKVLDIWRKADDKCLPREPGGKPLVFPPVEKIKELKTNGLTQVSLFSGAFGLDLGFMAAGFDPKVALDLDNDSLKTITTNLPDLPFIGEDIEKVTTKDILDASGLGKGDIDVLVGGPPCQPFSTAGKRMGLNDPRASPLREFIRVIKEAQPRCFVMEEVEGLKSARLKHVPVSEAGRQLTPEEEKGSAFKLIIEMLNGTGYKFTYDILNAADYGAPQVRNRLIFIGLREGEPSLPTATHSEVPQLHWEGGAVSPWNTLWDATADLQGGSQEFSNLSEKSKSYMGSVPPGGNWRNLPEEQIEGAMGGAYTSGGGKMGYYRRLSWDTPSPTVVTSPTQMATLFCHPEELRPLSVDEYKRAQGFPDDWYLPKSTAAKYKLIGNAVPVYLSYAIAQKVIELLRHEN